MAWLIVSLGSAKANRPNNDYDQENSLKIILGKRPDEICLVDNQ